MFIKKQIYLRVKVPLLHMSTSYTMILICVSDVLYAEENFESCIIFLFSFDMKLNLVRKHLIIFYLSHFLQVGDPVQLPATVISPIAGKFG